MGLAAAKILNKVRQALRKPKKKSSEQESMNYRKKLSREENKRKNEDFAAGEKRPKSKKKADNVKQMSDARLKREKQLNNPYLTYEDRAKLLGGFKKGGMLKKPTTPGLKKLPSEVRNKMGYMKKGGSVKGKCRMDGIAVRGKTRAKERSK